jgi:hypothetical protein
MVFLATTRRGYDAYMALNQTAGLWISTAVLTEEELRRLRSEGRHVTTFAHAVGTDDPDVLSEAIATIREHHPSESIWVEG